MKYYECEDKVKDDLKSKDQAIKNLVSENQRKKDLECQALALKLVQTVARLEKPHLDLNNAKKELLELLEPY